MREELIELAQTKQIRQKVEKIREATNEQLECIKDNYEVKKVKVAAKQLQTMVTKSFTKALHGAGVLEDERALQKDLDNNKLLEENVVKSILIWDWPLTILIWDWPLRTLLF